LTIGSSTASSAEDMPASRLVLAVFVGPYNAGAALGALHASGFTSDHVSVVAKNEDTRREIVEQTEMGESQDAPADSLMGALKGSVLGGALGLGALFIPGVGPLLAAGVLASAIGGAAIGAAVGGEAGVEEERGIAGADLAAVLIGRGVPEAEARVYEAHIRDNAILLAVQADSEEGAVLANQLFTQHGGADARIYGAPALRRERI